MGTLWSRPHEAAMADLPPQAIRICGIAAWHHSPALMPMTLTSSKHLINGAVQSHPQLVRGQRSLPHPCCPWNLSLHGHLHQPRQVSAWKTPHDRSRQRLISSSSSATRPTMPIRPLMRIGRQPERHGTPRLATGLTKTTMRMAARQPKLSWCWTRPGTWGSLGPVQHICMYPSC